MLPVCPVSSIRVRMTQFVSIGVRRKCVMAFSHSEMNALPVSFIMLFFSLSFLFYRFTVNHTLIRPAAGIFYVMIVDLPICLGVFFLRLKLKNFDFRIQKLMKFLWVFVFFDNRSGIQDSEIVQLKSDKFGSKTVVVPKVGQR